MNFEIISIGYNWINTWMVDHHTGKHPFPYFLFCCCIAGTVYYNSDLLAISFSEI